MILIVLLLSCFVGYYVNLKVTSALHAPLMAITNAISSIIIVVSLEIFNQYEQFSLQWWLILSAIFLTTINISGGLVITSRMLSMFNRK